MGIHLHKFGDGRTRTVVRNVIESFLLRFVSIAVSFLIVPITMDYVSPELYGVWLTLSSVILWLGFLDIGFTQGLKNKLTEAIALGDWERGRSLVSTTYFMMLAIFIPVCVLLQIVIPHINWSSILNCNPVFEEDIRSSMQILVVFMSIQMVVNVLVSVVAAFQKVALSTSFTVIGQVLSFVVILVIRKLCPPSLVTLCFSISAMPILVLIIASLILYSKRFKAVRPSYGMIRKELIGDLFGLGVKFFIINIQVIILYQSTNFLISYVSSPLEVTEYNVAYKYLNLAMMAFTIIMTPLWPAFTDAYVKKEIAWMVKTRKRMYMLLAISLVICFLMVLVSKPIYHIWIQDQTEVSMKMTLTVAVYVLFYCWMNLNGTLLLGMGKILVETILVVAGMLIHIPLSLFLSRYCGAYGVIYSMTAITFVYALVFNVQVDKLLSGKATGLWIR